MAAIIQGSLVYGNSKPLPLSSFPSGRVKIKIRQDDFVFVYVKNEAGITKFVVTEKDGHWLPCAAIEINKREESK